MYIVLTRCKVRASRSQWSVLQLLRRRRISRLNIISTAKIHQKHETKNKRFTDKSTIFTDYQKNIVSLQS